MYIYLHYYIQWIFSLLVDVACRGCRAVGTVALHGSRLSSCRHSTSLSDHVSRHNFWHICDTLLLNHRHRCQTLGNSIDIGSISHLNGSNNCLNYLVAEVNSKGPSARL